MSLVGEGLSSLEPGCRLGVPRRSLFRGLLRESALFTREQRIAEYREGGSKLKVEIL